VVARVQDNDLLVISGLVRNIKPKTLILLNSRFTNHHSPEEEKKLLYDIILLTESPQQFCIANELVDRNRITSKRKKIMKECSRLQLRPFRFLINKN
jgi:hypothetical protein